MTETTQTRKLAGRKAQWSYVGSTVTHSENDRQKERAMEGMKLKDITYRRSTEERKNVRKIPFIKGVNDP